MPRTEAAPYVGAQTPLAGAESPTASSVAQQDSALAVAAPVRAAAASCALSAAFHGPRVLSVRCFQLLLVHKQCTKSSGKRERGSSALPKCDSFAENDTDDDTSSSTSDATSHSSRCDSYCGDAEKEVFALREGAGDI